MAAAALAAAAAVGSAAGAALWLGVGAVVVACGVLFALVNPGLVLLGVALVRAPLDRIGDLHALATGGAEVRLTFLVNAALAGATALLLWRRLAGGGRLCVPAPLRALLLFTGWMTASTLWSVDPGETWHEAFRFLAVVAAAVLAADLVWHDPRWARRLAVASLVAAMIPAAAAVHQALTGSGDQSVADLNRAFGTLRHPNDFALFMAFMGIVALHLALDARARRRRAWHFALAGVAVLATGTLAYGRSATLALLIGATVSAAFRGRAPGRRALRLLGIGALLGALALPLGGRLMDRFETDSERLAGWTVDDVRDPIALSPMQFRLYMWSLAEEQIRARPLTGWGLGSFARHVDESTDAGPQNPHNDYLRVACETGLVGVVLFLALLAAVLRAALAGLRAGGDPLWPATLLGLVTTYAACSLSINVMASTGPLLYFWMTAGVALAAIERARPARRPGRVATEAGR